MSRIIRLLALFAVFAYSSSVSAEVQSFPGGVLPNANGQLPSMVGGVAPSVIFAATASSTANSTSDTSCYSTGVGPGATIPANGPYVGNTYRLRCTGVYTTPVVNTSTLTAKVKWGATTVASVTTAAFPASASNFPFFVEVVCTIRTPGASGTMSCAGTLSFAAALTGLSFLVNAIQTVTPTTIDTTVDSTIDLTASWSAITSTQSASGLVGTIEILY